MLRSGVSDSLPGRGLNVCERGIGAVLAGELMPGETVAVEVWLSGVNPPLRIPAAVRHQDRLRCGLEFVTMTAEQRTAIREWARNVMPEAEVKVKSTSSVNVKRLTGREWREGGGGGTGRPKSKRRGAKWLLGCVLIGIAALALWWKWNLDWEQIEAGLNTTVGARPEKPQAQVPAELMQRLLVHRVDPIYPTEARKENLQGVIALNVVVGRDGSVLSMRALNGPDILARAAMDALRWWKFEPYRLNGVPATVETTLAVEFKR